MKISICIFSENEAGLKNEPYPFEMITEELIENVIETTMKKIIGKDNK